MHRFTFPTNAEAHEYFSEIAERMTKYFAITTAEATSRVNAYHSESSYTTEIEICGLLHETIEYWAKTIYYAPEPIWWEDESKAKPRAYKTE